MADAPNRIRELRLARDWSQDKLANEVGCSKPQISDLERGNKPLTVEWMRRISRALTSSEAPISPADLLSQGDNPLLLSDAERELIERLRSATPEQRHNVERVTEALIPDGRRQAAA
jgi:transcriptional regulator with XRE-family HTH domain